MTFVLTKNDCNDFDRDVVSTLLNVNSSKSSAPTISKGRITNTVSNCKDVQKEISGITILTDNGPPFKFIKHASWSFSVSQNKCLSLTDVLSQMEATFSAKESIVRKICIDWNLKADLIIQITAPSDNLPVLDIPNASISFWASMGANIVFECYLD